MLPIEYTDIVVEEALMSGITMAIVTPPTAPPPQPEETKVSEVLIDFSSNMASKLLEDSLATVKTTPTMTVPHREASPTKQSGLVVSKPPMGAGGDRRAKPPGGSSPHRAGSKSGKNHTRQTSGGRGPKHKGGLGMIDGGDRLDPFSLQPPSSRMSMAWSTTSTRDDESSPPSPTELDSIVLRMVGNLEELAAMLADIIVKDAIGMCVMGHTYQPQNRHDLPSYASTSSIQYDDEKGFTKINNFLHSLQEMGSQRSLDLAHDGLLPYSPSWHHVQKSILRAVATGNWGCGAYRGDPQLKAMLQWMVVSACGRPEMKYHTFEDTRVSQVCIMSTSPPTNCSPHST